MRIYASILYTTVAVSNSFIAQAGNKLKSSEKPNIIVIYTDDQRQDALGANGNHVILTPQLDNLSNQGVRFSNANCVFALSSPSRAALLTGRYGSANGVLQLDSDLNPDEKTVAQYLHENGYLTALSGKWHIGRKPVDAGFDFSVWFSGNGRYYGRTIYDENDTIKPTIHCDQYCVNRSIDFLKQVSRQKKPFFLFHNPQLPHMNGQLIWDALQETKNRYKVENMPVAKSRLDSLSMKPEYLLNVRNRTQAKTYGYPDSVAIQTHTRDYYSVITEMDDFLGQLFQSIDSLGLRENTYIFFMSDNGWFLGEHGFTSKVLPYRPATHVPFFVVSPGLKPLTIDDLVLNIDVMPTILELAGIKKDASLHGRSLLPLLQNKKMKTRESFIYEGLGTYGGAKPNLTAVSKHFRYIETYSDENLNEVIYRELYDQRMDTDEMINLIEKPQMQKTVKRLSKSIAEHRKNIVKK